MKIKIFIFGLAALCITCFAASLPKITETVTQEPSYYTKGDIKVYTENYAEIYADTLTAMFGGNYCISEPKEMYYEGEKCDCGYDSYDKKYLQWTVSYEDQSGTDRQFLLNNSSTLSSQVENYIENYIAEYYENLIIDQHFSDVPLATSAYVFCFVDRIGENAFEVPEMDKKTQEYREKLETVDGCIRFSELTPENAFESAPIYLSVHISIDDSECTAGKAAEFQDAAEQEVVEVISELIERTNHTINADVSVSTHYGSNPMRKHYYVRGEEIPVDGIYERLVFDAYDGIFG